MVQGDGLRVCGDQTQVRSHKLEVVVNSNQTTDYIVRECQHTSTKGQCRGCTVWWNNHATTTNIRIVGINLDTHLDLRTGVCGDDVSKPVTQLKFVRTKARFASGQNWIAIL